MVKIDVNELISKADIEEKKYDWEKAAELYEKVTKSLLSEEMYKEAAEIFYKLGDVCYKAILASTTKEAFLDWTNRSMEAFQEAEELFNQANNNTFAIECHAKALLVKSYVIRSTEKTKSNLEQALDTFLHLYEKYSNLKEQNSCERIIVSTIVSLIQIILLCDLPSEIDKYCEITHNFIEKGWNFLKNFESFAAREKLIFAEGMLINIYRWMEQRYEDKEQLKVLERFLHKCKDSILQTRSCKDDSILGGIYTMTGFIYCLVGGLAVEEISEGINLAEKGFELLEKSISYCRKSRYNLGLCYSIYSLDYNAGVFGRYEYLQKRILKDVVELQKLGRIFENLYTGPYFLLDFIAIGYYNDFASRSFLKPDIRKSFAKTGIDYTKQILKRLAFGPYVVFAYQFLTQFYSQLVILAKDDEPREGHLTNMQIYANKAENIAKNYKGGNVRSAGLTSIYRANRTIADITKDKSKKKQYLEQAIEAAKKNVQYSIESYRIYLASQIRLGLLYEELGVLTIEEKPLIEAREIFLRIISDASEKGYYFYSAACYEYIARLEDRLGNHTISSEYYRKAQKAHQDSLISIKYKPLIERVEEKKNYAYAWNLIEKAKSYHKREQHITAKEMYEKAVNVLTTLPNFNHEAIYYRAWVILEEAEHLSKLEKNEDAIKRYKEARGMFDNSVLKIRIARKTIKRSRDLKKLEDVAKIRMEHCSARINLDEGRILAKRGDHILAAEKFSIAASQFRDICALYRIKRERAELEAIYYLCNAWGSMELAENYEDPEKFAEAANLFSKAGDLFTESKLKFLAHGNSNFCRALEEGSKFDRSLEIKEKAKLYRGMKSILRKTANLYEKGGFRNGSEWALGTSIYFDATWSLIQADNELNMKNKQVFLNLGLDYLKSAAEIFHTAGYKDKEREILERLERVSKEEKILLSALNTINKPSISRSIEGIIAPSCPIETSQSPRIGELQQYSDDVSKFLEKDSKGKKYEIIYKDLLQVYSKIQKSKCKVAIAQIGISTGKDIINDMFKLHKSGLLGLKETKINELNSIIKRMVEEAHDNGVDILIFPEMMIDLNHTLIYESLSSFAKLYQMYIIPGSYHDQLSKSNISIVIGPEGELWKQEKHIPALIHIDGNKIKEHINLSSFPRKIVVCNTEFGRIAIVICRDFLDMDLRVELKNFEPPVDIIINPAFTPVTADFKAAHFDARRSIYAYCFFANVAEFGDSLIYTPEKERIERTIPAKQEGLIYKDVDLFQLRSERKKWELEQIKEKSFIQSTR